MGAKTFITNLCLEVLDSKKQSLNSVNSTTSNHSIASVIMNREIHINTALSSLNNDALKCSRDRIPIVIISVLANIHV